MFTTKTMPIHPMLCWELIADFKDNFSCPIFFLLHYKYKFPESLSHFPKLHNFLVRKFLSERTQIYMKIIPSDLFQLYSNFTALTKVQCIKEKKTSTNFLLSVNTPITPTLANTKRQFSVSVFWNWISLSYSFQIDCFREGHILGRSWI